MGEDHWPVLAHPPCIAPVLGSAIGPATLARAALAMLAGMGLHDLRWKIIDGENSLGGRRRARRWRWLVKTFPDLDQMNVLDLGGLLSTWQRAPKRAKHVHVVNLSKPPADVPDWAEVELADAC